MGRGALIEENRSMSLKLLTDCNPDVKKRGRRSTVERFGVTGLILVDMQQGYLCRGNTRGRWLERHQPKVFEHFFDRIDDLVLPNTTRLLEAFREAALPIVHLRFGWHRTDSADLTSASHRERPAWATGDHDLVEFRIGGREHAIVASLEPREGEWVLDKMSRSAFTSTTFSQVLRRSNVTRLVVAGWATDACVDLTARDAVDRGWHTTIVEDATAAFSPDAHAAALNSFGRLFGEVRTTMSVLSALGAT